MALKNDGAVLAWGGNVLGQTTVPVRAQGGVTATAAGTYHTVVLKADGSVIAWGDNSFGQTTVPLVAQSGVAAIAAGSDYTVALLSTAVALQARPSGEGLVLAWPTNRAGFTLQSAPGLAAPVAWGDSAAAPAVVGDRYAVTNKAADGARFFRLRK